jgi:hypothetical protein
MSGLGLETAPARTAVLAILSTLEHAPDDRPLRTTERYVHAKAARSKAAVEALNDALS